MDFTLRANREGWERVAEENEHVQQVYGKQRGYCVVVFCMFWSLWTHRTDIRLRDMCDDYDDNNRTGFQGIEEFLKGDKRSAGFEWFERRECSGYLSLLDCT